MLLFKLLFKESLFKVQEGKKWNIWEAKEN